MLISQELFDDALQESQELFEYSNEEAIQETITEFTKNGVTTDHLCCYHPESEIGKRERSMRDQFCQSIDQEDYLTVLQMLQKSKQTPTTSSTNTSMKKGYQSLILQKGYLDDQNSTSSNHSKLLKPLAMEQIENADSDQVKLILEILIELLPESSIHPVTRDLRRKMSSAIKYIWCSLYYHFTKQKDDCIEIQILLIEWARLSCRACEENKKTFVRACLNDKVKYQNDQQISMLQYLVQSIPKTIYNDINQTVNEEQCHLAKSLCQLLTTLGRYEAAAEQQQQAQDDVDKNGPVVSSAHANVMELHKCGVVSSLYRLTRLYFENNNNGTNDVDEKSNNVDNNNDEQNNNDEFLAIVLAALRVLAIDNDIVQNMVAVGVLETADKCLSSTSTISSNLAAATLGLLRNLCANDEIKTSVCKKSLPSILHTMEIHPSHAAVQEHGCGILSAMALRDMNNSQQIIDANGVYYILQAMKTFPDKVPLQRQGALAIRNIASRNISGRQIILDLGADQVLRTITAMHQGSIEEAFAALRDLGCEVRMLKIDATGKATGTEEFGKVKSNFRAVYD